MNPVLEAIHARRSIRSYTHRQVPDQILRQILSAGQYAPSGSNSQSWLFLVLQNQDVLDQLNMGVRQAFAETEVDEGTYRSIRRGKKAAAAEQYCFYFGAPTLIVVSNETSYPNAMADSACALMNMQLAAHSLELGSCWINQLRWFGDRPAIRRLLEGVGMPTSHTVYGSLSLGYPSGSLPQAPARSGEPFIFVR